MVERLLESVLARLRAAEAGDIGPVLAAEALTDAARLLREAATPQGVDLRFLHAVGWLYWVRARALSATDRPAEPQTDQILFACFVPVFLAGPTRVPAELVDGLREAMSPAEAGAAGRAYDQALAFVVLSEITGASALLGPAVELLRDAALNLSEAGDPRRPTYLITLAAVLRTRYERSADPRDLDQAMSLLDEAAVPERHPERLRRLRERCDVLRLLIARDNDRHILDAAVESGREAIRTCPTDHDDRASVLSAAAIALLAAAGMNADQGLASEAVAAARQAVELCPPGHADRPRLLNNLGHALVSRAGIVENPADHSALLTEATTAFEEVIASTPPGDFIHDAGQYGLGRTLRLIWHQERDHAMLERAVQALRASTRALPRSPELAIRLASLGEAQSLLHRHTRAPGALDDAVEAYRRAVELMPTGHPIIAGWQDRLARLYEERWSARGTEDAAEEAIAAYRRLLESTPPESPEYARTLVALASTQFFRGMRYSNEQSLADAEHNGRAALRTGTFDGKELARTQANLAAVLIERAFRGSGLSGWEEAEQLLRAAVREAALEPEDTAKIWLNLSTVLHRRFLRTRDDGLLHEAIASCRRALELGEEPVEQAVRLAALGELLRDDKRNGALDEAVRVGRQAVRDCAPDHPRRASILRRLAEALRTRYARRGDPADLDEAIALLREEVTLGDRERPGFGLLALALALSERYRRVPDLATLEEAIRFGRAATVALPPAHQERPKALSNLSGHLAAHYSRTGSVDSLKEAIECARAAVTATPTGDAALAVRLGNLAIALCGWFDHTADPADLSAAITTHRRALEVMPSGHPERHRLLATLGRSLLAYGELTRTPDAVDEGVGRLREAMAATPPDHPLSARRKVDLAFALMEQEDQATDLQHFLEILRVAEAAAAVTTAPPLDRLQAARLGAAVAAATLRRKKAAEGYRQAVQLLPLVVPRTLRRADLEHELTELSELTIATDAAATSVRIRRPAEALELLEQGRGVLLSYALDTRHELDDLRAAAPALAEEFSVLRERLNEAPDDRIGIEEPSAESGPSLGETDRRYRLAAQWEGVLGRIRSLPRFERFLLPPRIEDMARAAADGPVVTINVSKHGCAALILTADKVRVVRLRRLTVESLAARVSTFLEALARGTGPEAGMAERLEAEATIQDTLGWLWDSVTGPVLDALGHRRPPPAGSPWPRVWWSPTWALNFLPLHAAGHHADRGPAVLDRVVSSYTPTIRALLHARSRPPSPRRQLAVALPDTPGEEPLPAAHDELTALAAWLGDDRRLIGAEATHDEVLTKLRAASWVHFACHARSDPTRPSENHLLLHDRPLRVVEISRLEHPGAELAYLSACSTARGSMELADEAIHLASAFQLAGYRHVVATLWPVFDDAASTVAQSFYQRLSTSTGAADAALALHNAVRELRDSRRLAPSNWAGYVHAGP